MSAFTSVTAGTPVGGTGALSVSAPTRASGDLLLLLTATRAGDETFNGAPTGWSVLYDASAGDLTLLGRYATNDLNDDVTSYDFWSGNSSASACIFRVQGGGSGSLASIVVGTPGTVSNSGDDIYCPAATALENNCLCLGIARKSKNDTSNDATLLSSPTGLSNNVLFYYPNGYTCGLVLNYAIQTTATNITAQDPGWNISIDQSTGRTAAVLFLSSGAAPTLSSPTPSGTLGTQTTATIGCTTDISSGTLYGVVDTDSLSGITGAQVKAGTDASDGAVIWDGSGAVSSTTPSLGAAGLTANTTYNYDLVQNYGGGSNVVTGSFTTAAVTAATFTGTTTVTPSTGGGTVNSKITAANATVYVVTVKKDDAAPSLAQIKAGQNQAGS